MYVVNSEIQCGSFVRFKIIVYFYWSWKHKFAFNLKVVGNMHDLATHVGFIYIRKHDHFGNVVQLAKVKDFLNCHVGAWISYGSSFLGVHDVRFQLQDPR